MFKSAFAVLLLSFACVCAEAQTNLPSAPAPAAPHPDFSMPATMPHTTIYQSPTADTPSPSKTDTYCTAPSDGGFRTKQHLSPSQKGELKDFRSAMMQRLYVQWLRHMPRAATDPWIHGAAVLLRFEITPDGAIHDPAIMMSSGRHDYDDHVLRSLIAAQPYPLPNGFTEPLSACINFAYNVNHEDHFTPDPLTPKPHKPRP